MQNAFIESINGRLRDELLNETLFTSFALSEARIENFPYGHVWTPPSMQEESFVGARSVVGC